MTRKDYVALAKVIRAHVEEARHYDRSNGESTLRRLVKDMLPILKSDNRSFSADRFLVACGFDATEGY